MNISMNTKLVRFYIRLLQTFWPLLGVERTARLAEHPITRT